MSTQTNLNPITQVTVFEDRALITRSIASENFQGERTITVSPLPDALLENSLRAKDLNQQAKIMALDLRRETTCVPPDEAQQGLEQKIREQTLALEELQGRHQLTAAYLGLIPLFMPGAPAELPSDLSYAKPFWSSYQDLYNLIVQFQEKLGGELLLLEEKIKEKTREHSLLKRQLAELGQGALSHSYKTCSLTLESQKESKPQIKLSYMVPHCYWVPYYEARLFLEEEELEIHHFAKINQQTGEDWSNVSLSLSTARPSQAGTPPELSTWILDFYRPPAAPSREKMKKMSSRAMMKEEGEKEEDEEIPVPCCEVSDQFAETGSLDDLMVSSPAPEEKVAVLEQSNITSSGANAEFELPQKEDVPSGKDENKAFITKKRYPLKLEYIIIPREAESAFIKGTLLHEAVYPLLPGQAFVFHGSDYIGKSALPLTRPGENLEIFLGRDERILVERLLIERFQSKKGLTQNQTKISFHYRLRLTNRKTKPVNVKIFDNLPLSKNAQLKVKLLSTHPAHQNLDEKGILSWELELAPDAVQNIELKYELDYPKGAIINEIF